MNEPCNGNCSTCPLVHGHYVIPGRPVPLQRPRFISKHNTVWNKQKQIMVNTGIVLDSQHTQDHFTGPLLVFMTFSFAPPKSCSRTKYESLIDSYHIFKPDLSNLIKFVEDCANQVLFKDDALIAQLFCQKVYARQEDTRMSIYQLENNNER